MKRQKTKEDAQDQQTLALINKKDETPADTLSDPTSEQRLTGNNTKDGKQDEKGDADRTSSKIEIDLPDADPGLLPAQKKSLEKKEKARRKSE